MWQWQRRECDGTKRVTPLTCDRTSEAPRRILNGFGRGPGDADNTSSRPSGRKYPYMAMDRLNYSSDRAIRSTCTAIIRSSCAGTTKTDVFDSGGLIRRTPFVLASFDGELTEIPRS
jgi:hypothetical protein